MVVLYQTDCLLSTVLKLFLVSERNNLPIVRTYSPTYSNAQNRCEQPGCNAGPSFNLAHHDASFPEQFLFSHQHCFNSGVKTRDNQMKEASSFIATFHWKRRGVAGCREGRRMNEKCTRLKSKEQNVAFSSAIINNQFQIVGNIFFLSSLKSEVSIL